MQFEVRDNTIHVLNYPDADMILGLPDSQYVKRLKDMWLHWWDLNEAKQSLESMNSNNSDVVNRALAQNSIVVFYKCFGKSEFRDNSLKRNKILANFPPEAKKVFDFYKDLRDKFIVHDESRLSQALAGVILQSNKEHYPFYNGALDIPLLLIGYSELTYGENGILIHHSERSKYDAYIHDFKAVKRMLEIIK